MILVAAFILVGSAIQFVYIYLENKKALAEYKKEQETLEFDERKIYE